MADVADLRRAALACPGAVEQPHWGAPAFRVKGRIFAQVAVKDWDAGGPYRAIVDCAEDRRLKLCEAAPGTYSLCQWGQIRRLFVALEAVSAEELGDLVRESWARAGRGGRRA